MATQARVYNIETQQKRFSIYKNAHQRLMGWFFFLVNLTGLASSLLQKYFQMVLSLTMIRSASFLICGLSSIVIIILSLRWKDMEEREDPAREIDIDSKSSRSEVSSDAGSMVSDSNDEQTDQSSDGRTEASDTRYKHVKEHRSLFDDARLSLRIIKHACQMKNVWKLTIIYLSLTFLNQRIIPKALYDRKRKQLSWMLRPNHASPFFQGCPIGYLSHMISSLIFMY